MKQESDEPVGITQLLEKLERAKFSGELRLHLYQGEITGAELHHHLANNEFQSRELPTVEPEKGFALKP
jgi:hypothetical protein